MALESYYEPFYVQELVEKTSDFPPPWNETLSVLQDGKGIMGIFKQEQSGRTMIAEAQGVATVGRFACCSSEILEDSTVLRRVKDNVYIVIKGTPLTSPPQASTSVSTWTAQTTNRGDIESDTGENNEVTE